jgi:hypothetical protein
MTDMPLVCPRCGRTFARTERFCESCAMPLVARFSDERGSRDPRRERARKIKPEYAEGPPVRVAEADTLPEADFIAALLLEWGIPSVCSTPIGGYGPMLGRREVLVPESGAQAAREALAPRPG